MKKFVFFLMAITSFFVLPKVAHAEEYFYEDNFISGIYMNRYSPSTQTFFYQTARFFRQSSTGDFAYCIQPFVGFQEGIGYEETFDPNSLTQTQKNRIAAIAHYGYGYTNHNEEKWYAITQLLIWKEANPNDDFYFTDSLNGNRITLFESEMNEILGLVDRSFILPSFSNQEFHIVLGEDFVLTDTNNVLSEYSSDVDYAKIDGNKLRISISQEGFRQVVFKRKDNIYNQPVVFYQSNVNQDLVKLGNITFNNSVIQLCIDATEVTLDKIDKDTQEAKPTGEAILDGAVFELLNSNMEKIKTITFKDNHAVLKNLPYGTYYLREIKAGKGYSINKKLYQFELSFGTRNASLTLENEVIKSKLTIYKEYGDKDNFQPEANIKFNIYNSKKELIETITTNELGYAELVLPYGKYYIEQASTTEGYEKIEPFAFEVKDSKPITYKLKNYKIEVPNTHTDNDFFDTLISFLINLLCLKRYSYFF